MSASLPDKSAQEKSTQINSPKHSTNTASFSTASNQGRFISFEGTEGVGKTTAIEQLCVHLQAKGIDYLRTREPGGSPFDQACAGPWRRLREALTDEGPIPLACFATTVELRGQTDVNDQDAAADAAALLRFLQRRGALAGDPGPLPQPCCEPTPLDGVDVLTAPAAGVLVYRKRLGERVQVGEVVAELVDPLSEPLGAARTPICAATNGLLLTRMSERLVRPGQKFCKIAGREPLSYRRAGQLLED